MESIVVKPKAYTRERFSQTSELPTAKGGVEVTWPFQWMLYKPQAHAIPVFETNHASRSDNTQRVTGPSGPR
jgi:hypothetical protein